jgi:hypothetical protein
MRSPVVNEFYKKQLIAPWAQSLYPRTPSITMRIFSSVGKRRRVARLVLRIRARAVSAERVAPVISGERVSTLFSSGMFTLPAQSRAAGVDSRKGQTRKLLRPEVSHTLNGAWLH